MNTTPSSALAKASIKPDLDSIRAELDSVLSQAGDIQARQMAASCVRYALWEGQSDDYRKHAEAIGDVAKPYEGAADTRPREADKIITQRTALLVESLFSGDMQVGPVSSDDAEGATKLTRILIWLRKRILAAELRNEATLLANYQEGDDPGIGVLKVYWKRDMGTEMRQLSLMEVAGELLKQRGVVVNPDGTVDPRRQGALDDVTDLIFNKARADEAAAAFAEVFPQVAPRLIKQAVRELRKTSATALPMPYVKENRPAVAALRYMDDVFFPPDIGDIQRARVIYEREWLSEPELRERHHTEGWGEDFIEAVLEAGAGGDERVSSVTIDGVRETDSLYEVWNAYSKSSDDYGVPGIYRTVFSRQVKEDVYGLHELFDYPYGGYSYVLFRRETIDRRIGTSRGVPTIAGSAQYEIKVQRDCRTDHTQISTIPPVRVNKRLGGLRQVLGPMVQIDVRDPNDVSWMTPPQLPVSSTEVERAARSDLDEYFGRMVAAVTPELRTSTISAMVNQWLTGWTSAWTMIVQLLQDYMDPMELSLAAGSPMQKISREEIRGGYHVEVAFNARDLSLDYVMARMDAVAKILPWDSNGEVDHSVLVRFAFRAIDPNLAETALRSTGAVTQAEVKDETSALAQMAQGIEPDLQQTGINATLRLNVLQKKLQASPVLLRRYLQPANDDDALFKKLVDNRMKNLQFLVQQYQQNAEIGRVGTAPVLGQ